jgi:hypothetical protein
LHESPWHFRVALKGTVFDATALAVAALAQLGHLARHDEAAARAWLYGKLLLASLRRKLARFGHDFSNVASGSTSSQPISAWRQFRFLLHAIRQAIEPVLPLRQILGNWNQLAAEVNEAPRRRMALS